MKKLKKIDIPRTLYSKHASKIYDYRNVEILDLQYKYFVPSEDHFLGRGGQRVRPHVHTFVQNLFTE